jgi:hypothetical protein
VADFPFHRDGEEALAQLTGFAQPEHAILAFHLLAAGGGCGKDPGPALPKAFISALSSNSPTMRGRAPSGNASAGASNW